MLFREDCDQLKDDIKELGQQLREREEQTRRDNIPTHNSVFPTTEKVKESLPPGFRAVIVKLNYGRVKVYGGAKPPENRNDIECLAAGARNMYPGKVELICG